MSGSTTRHLVRELRDRVNGTDWTDASHDKLMSELENALELLQTLCGCVERLSERVTTLEGESRR